MIKTAHSLSNVLKVRRHFMLSVLLMGMAFHCQAATVEESLDKLRQAVVDLHATLDGKISDGDANLIRRLNSLQLALSELRANTQQDNVGLSRTVAELSTTIANITGKLAEVDRQSKTIPPALYNELTSLKARLRTIESQLQKIAISQSKPTAQDNNDGASIMCEIHGDLNRKGYLTHQNQRSHRSRGTQIVDVLEKACADCGPVDDRRDSGDFYIKTCSLVGCWYEGNGTAVTSFDNMLRMTPFKCRRSAHTPVVAPDKYKCGMTYSNEVHAGWGAHSSATRSRAIKSTGETKAAAIASACNRCLNQGRNAQSEARKIGLIWWSCHSLSCSTGQDKQIVTIGSREVPKGCLATYRRQ